MRGSFEELAASFLNNDNFVISGHINPDGDVIGSVFGLFTIFKELGKKAIITLDPPAVPKKYAFVQNTNVYSPSKIESVNIFIALECPMIKRLGDELKGKAMAAQSLINIDHHGDNEIYGEINFVMPEAASTTEIIYRLIPFLGIEISPEIANSLYMGLVTDTGRFQYSNTRAETLQIASELVAKGANPNHIFQNIYENITYGALLLLGKMASVAKIEDSYLIWSVIDKKESRLPVDPGETENLVDHLRAVSGPEIAALLKVDETDVKCSLRSRGKINVAKIAEKFGGGGHPNAAGFSAKLSPDEIIKKLKILIKEALK